MNNSKDINSDFPVSIQLKAVDSIDLENLGLLLPFSVTDFDSCFIFSNIRSKNRVSILNKENHQLTDVIHIGEGPNEIIQYLPINNNDNDFLFIDRIRGKMFKLNLNGDYSHQLITEFNDSINRFYSLAKIDSIHIIGTGFFDKGRFAIYNIKDHSFKYSENYPINRDINNLTKFQQAALFAGTLIGVHPDGNKLVAAHKGLIDFYTINKDQTLNLVNQKYYHFPLFAIPENGPIIAHKKEEITGFLSLCYDSSYVYLLYSNTSFYEKGSETFSGNKIFIYSWDGTPTKCYTLDHDLLSISIKGQNLLGIEKNHRYLYQYKLQ